MASQLIEEQRKGAEVHAGHDLCEEKMKQLLAELGLPKGLLPLEEIREFGHNRSSGFVWAIQKKKKNHTFEKIKQVTSYAAEVTAFVDGRKLKKVNGIKAREMLIWVSIVEVGINDSAPDKVVFLSSAGLSKTFPASAFE
ncbi:uncharacterized protein LOC122003164 [Zingiber officinale]|uniref:Uncharacterized protein n=1 Tax=Zingiber officinale TaxID=94328 RepID=A0A8J5ILU8_ZINOF|nr:uncharacterized protein LOC122003164 [Zingiber officinale]KAG6537394.1 hypothetical protein ZIOFF_002484 [Zingiber officinale]